jgi:broad specificity phosphatase PhoE
MRRLYLVRHAEPDIDPTLPASEWPLTARGVASTRRLAATLSDFGPTVIVSSPERKAVETANLIAESLEIAVAVDARVSEHGAGPDAFINDYAEFRAMVQRHFEEASDVVFRQESSLEAGARFAACAGELCQADDIPVLVSHGRIMASWLAELSGTPAWEIWTNLRLPDLIEVDLDAQTYRMVEGQFV